MGKANNAEAVAEQKFNKDALLQSVEFVRYRDLLKVILKDGELFAISEVKEKLKAYLNKEV